MEPQNNQTPDQKTDFQNARLAVLKDIKSLIVFSSYDFSRQLVLDEMIITRNQPDPDIVMDVLVPSFEKFQNHIQNKIDELIEGRSLYAVLQTHQLGAYRSITGGDYHAGVKSAAEDAQVLIAALNPNLATKLVLEEIEKKPPYSDANEDQIKEMIHFGISCSIDSSITRIQKKLSKAKRPEVIAFEGGQEQEMPNRSLADYFFMFADNSYKSVILKSSIPSVWPTLHDIAEACKSGNGTVMSQSLNGQSATTKQTVRRNLDFENRLDVSDHPKDNDDARIQCYQALDHIPRNSTPDFVRGFIETLLEISEEVQVQHFKAYNSPEGYKGLLGPTANGSIENVIRQLAPVYMDDIRHVIMRELHDKNCARGTGEDEIDGEVAAFEWAQQVLKNYTPPADLHDTATKQNALLLLTGKWQEFINNVRESDTTQPQPKRNLPTPPDPFEP